MRYKPYLPVLLALLLVSCGDGDPPLAPTADQPALSKSPGQDHRGTIAFNTNRDGGADQEIFTMNADGTGVRQLTQNASSDMGPAWSPNGKEIAFASDRDGDAEIYVMNLNGTGVTQLTNNAGAVDFIPQQS